MDISGFGGNFTANLATELVKQGVGLLLKQGAGLLRGAMLGDDETRALARSVAEALQAAISQVALRALLIDEAALQQAKSAIEMIFRADSTAVAFVAAALNGQGDARRVTGLAESAGLDLATLPFDWNEFLNLFLAALNRELHKEASHPGSPLRDRVALGELFRLRCAVTTLSTSISAVIDRLTAEFSEVDPGALFDQFLKEYLGLPDRPKPFGGRRHEIERLNSWLYDLQSPSKLLLVAPAGKGKSALLAHWARQLPQDVTTVFIPVSLRFLTAQPTMFLPALASRLARLHGMSLLASTLHNVNACRNIIVSLLTRELPTGGMLLVIIDGLDEAGDRFSWAGLLPHDPPDSVRIVVSARQLSGDRQGDRWMARVGWDAFPERVRPLALEGLDCAGVREALESMGINIPQSDPELDIVAQLHRLTDGDPLLIGLYAEALWKDQHHQGTTHPWRPAELKNAVPGLKGFFDRWLAGQQMLWGDNQPLKESETRAVLAILSQAIGPLRNDELREMIRRAYAISDWSVRETLVPLARFVIGDGQKQGYVFSHPRLAEFFGSDEYVSEEMIIRVQRSFLTWGSDTLRNLQAVDGPPPNVPYYLLTCFGEHLVRAGGHSATLMSLICQGWLRAWERLDPTHRGFLADVVRAWDAVRPDALSPDRPISAIADEARCLLCVCSVQSPHKLPAPTVFAAALESGLVTPTQVLSVLASVLDRSDFEEHVRDLAPVIGGLVGVEMANLADLRPPSSAKVSALLAIADQLKPPDSVQVVDKAFRAARGCDNEYEELYAAISLIRHTPRASQHELARRAIERLLNADRQLIQSQAIIDIHPFVGAAIWPWAKRVIDYLFEFSTNVVEPLAPTVFDLLPEQERRVFVMNFLARPIEATVADRGLLLNMVVRHLNDEEWTFIISKLEALDAEDRTIVLSSILSRAPIDQIEQLIYASLHEFLLRSSIENSIGSVNWSHLLPFVETEVRRRMLSVLISYAPLATSSDYWLRVLPQALPFLPLAEKKALSSQIMSQGHHHHDEAAVLPLLGGAIEYLPRSRQPSAGQRVADRTARHVARVLRSEEWRRIISLGSLLPLTKSSQASELAERIFELQRTHHATRVGSILEIISYLPSARQAEAAPFLAEWSRQASGEFSAAGQLLEARKWLADPDFSAAADRLFRRADAEPDPRMRAMYLAHVLRLLPDGPRDAVIRELIDMAQALAEWDDAWTSILRLVIEAANPPSITRSIFPFLELLQTKDRLASFLLFIQVAIRHSRTRSQALQSALALLPLRHWALAELVEALPVLPRNLQVLALDIIFQLILNEQPGRPIGILARIFPTVAELAGEEVAAQLWETIWDVTQWWP